MSFREQVNPKGGNSSSSSSSNRRNNVVSPLSASHPRPPASSQGISHHNNSSSTNTGTGTGNHHNPYPAMEGLYIYTANKLEALRKGDHSGGPKQYKIVDVQELKTLALWRAVLAEFLAQILFVFLGGCSAMFLKDYGVTSGDNGAKAIKIAFGFGLAIMALIQMIGHVSGGHINPAVTIAMAVTLKISIARAFFYVVAQVVGSIVGGFLLKGLTPSELHDNLPVTGIDSKLTPGQGLGIEIILTFVLVFVIFGTTDENRPSFGSPALLIGLTITLLHLAGIESTGASMNPTRSLGVAVAADEYSDHWVYWVGPIVGGIAAALAYCLIFSPYRGMLSMDSAVQRMLQDENFVAIPRDYFKDGGSRGNGKDVTASSNL